MKNSVLIGSAALLVVGVVVVSRNEKLKKMISQAVKDGLASQAVQDILEYAKNSTIKEIQAKFNSLKGEYRPAFNIVEEKLGLK